MLDVFTYMLTNAVSVNRNTGDCIYYLRKCMLAVRFGRIIRHALPNMPDNPAFSFQIPDIRLNPNLEPRFRSMQLF